jgi:hypothetical protein
MIEIRSTAELGKSLSVKREKDGDDVIVACHLKFADLFCDREQFDEICRQPIGWHGAFFDELGAPVNVFDIGLPLSSWSVTGRIKGGESRPEELRLLQATLSDVTCRLAKLGALLSGSLSWKARGDEVEDLTELLGRLVSVDWKITDGGQQDAFRQAVEAPLQRLQDSADRTGHTMTISTGDGEEIATFAPKAGRITSFNAAMRLLESGYHLRGASPDYWVEKPDGTKRQGVWLNAANACLKSGDLEPIGDGDTDEVGRWKVRTAA